MKTIDDVLPESTPEVGTAEVDSLTQDQIKTVYKVMDAVRQIVLPRFGKQTCILCTRLAIEVLHRFKIRATPLPVMCIINNPAWSRLAKALGREPETAEESSEWFQQHGAYGIGIGHPEREEALHLVALVENAFILDLTLDQGNCPEKQIVLSPWLLEANLSFLSDDEPAVGINNGCEVIYFKKPHKQAYVKSEFWHLRNNYDGLLNQLFQRLLHLERRTDRKEKKRCRRNERRRKKKGGG